MAKAIMVQSSMSNAGKSLLVAGLCRILAQDGYRVAPFKSQNMALNSYVTREGLEMGRAQVMQAQAAGIEPQVGMNPILLKPTSHVGSQVIVQGEVVKTMSATEYFAYKNTLIPLVQQAYDKLARNFDIVVLEGAGSPAEINLKQNDLVNMGMAAMAQAPVLLVGDVNPGGVFAQLYGTLKLLSASEQKYVKGLVVNKFRGDPSILQPGLDQLEKLCNKPVVGVVPYLDIDLDDEDSLSDRLSVRAHTGVLDIAIVQVPHLSNFTDFNQLSRHESVGVRYVDKAIDLGRPDLVMVPGSKNTMADTRWLHQSGMGECIKALSATNTPIMGICGGFQMLGREVRDPQGVEGGGVVEGLGLLDVCTSLTSQKTRTQAQGVVCVEHGFFAALNNVAVEGYEIHMGETQANTPCATHLAVGKQAHTKDEGAVQGNVMGTYLHGFFDTAGVVDVLARALLKARGLSASESFTCDNNTYLQQQFDALAHQLRQALDMQSVYNMIRSGL